MCTVVRLFCDVGGKVDSRGFAFVEFFFFVPFRRSPSVGLAVQVDRFFRHSRSFCLGCASFTRVIVQANARWQQEEACGRGIVFIGVLRQSALVCHGNGVGALFIVDCTRFLTLLI